MCDVCKKVVGSVVALLILFVCGAMTAMAQQTAYDAGSFVKSITPKLILPDAQSWEGDQQAHTLSVVELNRGGYKYWGWYGLNAGRGMGLARSNDLLHWTKYEKNPLWLNARWPSVLANANPKQPKLLYFAITRNYDTPTSHIVLATSKDGIHLKEIKNLVNPVPNQRNQNPNLFRDPVSGKFFLTFYRGNDENYFDIVSKSAEKIEDLDRAPEKLLMHTSETLAAPALLHIRMPGGKNSYYLATEIYPSRYSNPPKGEWQVKLFVSNAPDGSFEAVEGNPVQVGERACLFPHVFNRRFYGFQSHLDHSTEKWVMEVLEAPLPQ